MNEREFPKIEAVDEFPQTVYHPESEIREIFEQIRKLKIVRITPADWRRMKKARKEHFRSRVLSYARENKLKVRSSVQKDGLYIQLKDNRGRKPKR